MEQIVDQGHRREKLVKVGLSVEISDLTLSAEEKFILLAALGRVQLESPSDAILKVHLKAATLGANAMGVRAKLMLRASNHSFEIESRGEQISLVVRQIEELACAELAAWRKSRLSP